jgi:hypothetical protein
MMADRRVVLDERGFKTMVVRAEDGRDAGKLFKISEWPAARAEDWALRMSAALTRGGIPFPAEAVWGQGMVAVVAIGIESLLRGQVNASEVSPLWNELMECVKMIRDPKAVDKSTGKIVVSDIVSESDIMEVKTRGWLKSEVLWLHTGFSPADALSNLISGVMKASASSTIQTSPP